MRATIQRLAGLGCAALFGVAGYWSVRFAYADMLFQSSSVEQLEKAVALAPANVDYWLRWADLFEESGTPVSIEAYERTAQRDVYNATLWIRLGLQVEARRDYPLAERFLLRAAEVNQQYLPRWTLANFYFRRGDADQFRRWAKLSFERSYGDNRPLFDLCSLFNFSNAQILGLLPDKAVVRRAYLHYLLERGQLGSAAETGRSVMSGATLDDKPVLLRYCSRMLEAHRWEDALLAWNTLCARKLLPCAVLEPGKGVSLSNGGFHSEPTAEGYDWRLSVLTGVSMRVTQPAPALEIVFSGKQPERCELMHQIVPVLAGEKYSLFFDFQPSEIAWKSGLRWKIFQAETGAEVAVQEARLTQGNSGRVEFVAPAAAIRLALAYERVRGTTRIEGSILLRNLRLEVQQPLHRKTGNPH